MKLSDYYPEFEGWTPVEPAPAEQRPQMPTPEVQVSPFLRTVLPLPMQYSGDTIKQYNRPGLSSFRTHPLPPGGIPSINSASQTVSKKSTPSIRVTQAFNSTDVSKIGVTPVSNNGTPTSEVFVGGATAMDQLLDGPTTFGKPLLSRLNTGRPTIDFSEAIHSNKNIDNVADGSTRFARTAAHSSYRPLSNPLTAHDAGASVIVNVAAATNRVGGTDVSINSGSVSGLSYSTLYYTDYDDSALAGGAVTYSARTTKETSIGSAARFFLGSVMTPKAIGPDTVGNGDGGTGAQFGQQFTIRPSASTTSQTGLVGGANGVTNPGNSFDGDPTTSTTITTADNAVAPNESVTFTLSGFPASFMSFAAITLKVYSSVTGFVAGAPNPTATVSYSTNGGASYTNIYSVSANRGATVDSVSLPQGTNLANVRVKVVTDGANGGGAITVNLSEAWVEASV